MGHLADLTLRERKKRRTQLALERAAVELFAKRGFDGTTVDDIVHKVEVSRRTFFRYFATKEDVVLTLRDDFGDALCALVSERPAHESPMRALRNALRLSATKLVSDTQERVALVRLIYETPSIRARHLEKQEQQVQKLARAIAGRQPKVADVLVSQVLAASALTTWQVVLRTWSATDGHHDLGQLLDKAFDALEDASRKP